MFVRFVVRSFIIMLHMELNRMHRILITQFVWGEERATVLIAVVLINIDGYGG